MKTFLNQAVLEVLRREWGPTESVEFLTVPPASACCLLNFHYLAMQRPPGRMWLFSQMDSHLQKELGTK